MRADFSDSSGQFSAACFEESLVPDFERWAAAGECLLLTVELDSPSPDEPPRLTVRGALVDRILIRDLSPQALVLAQQGPDRQFLQKAAHRVGLVHGQTQQAPADNIVAYLWVGFGQ